MCPWGPRLAAISRSWPNTSPTHFLSLLQFYIRWYYKIAPKVNIPKQEALSIQEGSSAILINENWPPSPKSATQRSLITEALFIGQGRRWPQSVRPQRAHWKENSNLASKTELDTGGERRLEAMLHFALWPTVPCLDKNNQPVLLQNSQLTQYNKTRSMCERNKIKLIKIDTYHMWVEVINCGSRSNFSSAWFWYRWLV